MIRDSVPPEECTRIHAMVNGRFCPLCGQDLDSVSAWDLSQEFLAVVSADAIERGEATVAWRADFCAVITRAPRGQCVICHAVVGCRRNTRCSVTGEALCEGCEQWVDGDACGRCGHIHP